MKLPQLWIVLIIVAGMGLTGLLGVQAASALKARPTAMAVADVQKIFDALAEKVQVEADLQTKADRLKQEQQDRQKELRQLQSDMEILAAGTPAYNQKEEELTRKAVELRAWAEFQERRLSRDRGLQIENLYRKMTDAIGRVAKENGYDAVLFKESTVKFNTDKPEQLATLIQVRKVLWSADDLDVTDQVIQKMNNEFKNMAK